MGLVPRGVGFGVWDVGFGVRGLARPDDLHEGAVRTGSWTGPPRGKGVPRVGISSTVFGVSTPRCGLSGVGFGIEVQRERDLACLRSVSFLRVWGPGC